MKLFEFQFLLEMGAKKACAVCGHSMANFHFYRNGGWYCKTSSLSAPAPGADVAACKAALAAGKAPRVSNIASTPSVTAPTAPVSKVVATPSPTTAPKQPAPQVSPPAPTKPSAPAGSLQEKIGAWLNAQGINNFTINKDNSVDVADSIHLSNLRYKKLPVQFNKIDGDVHIAGGLLETLHGLPTDLSGQLSISKVDLSSWDGCPTSMEALDLHSITVPGPLPKFKSIPGVVSLNHLKGLSNLVGLPETIGGLNISECKNLATLDGLPKQINGSVHIQEYNGAKLNSLEAFSNSNIAGKVLISLSGQKAPIPLPSQFNTTDSVELTGDFSGSIAFPAEIDGDLILESRYDAPTAYNNVNVTNWPTKIKGNLTMSANMLDKIQKISRVIREVDGTITIQHAYIPHPDSPYAKPGTVVVGALLGLTQIKGVKKIDLGGNGMNDTTKFLQHTVNRVIAGDIEMLEAQEILIDAGHSKQARL